MTAMWSLKGKPKEVQREALSRAEGRRGFAYFMEMGLGKTATVLAEFINLVMRDEVELLIVVCPNTLKDNWRSEAEEWGIADHLNLAVWPELPVRGKMPAMLVINYEAFAIGTEPAVDVCRGAMQKYKTYVALDESIQIKKHNGKRTQNLIMLSKYARYLRILSGHPVSQGPHDLWAQLRFINCLNINYFVFRNRFCVMGGYKAKKVVGPKNVEELNKLLQSCSFRAKKDDWLDLPPKIFPPPRTVTLTKEQQQAYKEMDTEFMTVVGGELVSAEIVLTQMLRLQQISSGFVVTETGDLQRMVKKNPKIEAVKEVLEEVEGKVIVMCLYRESVNWLYGELAAWHPAVIGSIDDVRQDVEAEKTKFNNDPECRVIICQIDSAKYGHTLLAQPDDRCATTIFYENSYDLDERVQAEDRNHRIGQDSKSVVYIDFVSAPCDVAAIRALQRKEDVAKAVVDGVKHDS